MGRIANQTISNDTLRAASCKTAWRSISDSAAALRPNKGRMLLDFPMRNSLSQGSFSAHTTSLPHADNQAQGYTGSHQGHGQDGSCNIQIVACIERHILPWEAQVWCTGCANRMLCPIFEAHKCKSPCNNGPTPDAHLLPPTASCAVGLRCMSVYTLRYI